MRRLVLKVIDTIYCTFCDGMQAELLFLRIKMIVLIQQYECIV